MAGLDPHARPPEGIRTLYKRYQKATVASLAADPDIIDFARSSNHGVHAVRQVNTADLADILGLPSEATGQCSTVQAYELDALPGLHVIPGLLDTMVQRELLNRLLHRDLADPRHRNNVGMHYHIPYEVCASPGQLSHPDQAAREAGNDMAASTAASGSFFTCSPYSDVSFHPIDASMHKALSISQFLNRKLRWMTLGGQYDWTRKVYHTDTPSFPSDIAALVQTLFPAMRPESAICNVYTPSDTLSLHRDVAEEVDAGLASLSIGCEAIFVVGGERPEAAGGANGPTASAISSTAIRLRSGDAVYMSGPARYAWHGVPRVLVDTCPAELESWPAERTRKEGDCFAHWQGWLAHKRINLNVRQMRP